MTLSELKNFDGRNGKPAYVAVSGMIYDVSSSKHWQQGNHEETHQAGQDLTEEMKTAPHVRSVIERFPVVGQLTTAGTTPPSAKKLPVVAVVAVLIVVLALVLMLLR